MRYTVNLQSFLNPVLPQFPTVREDAEIEVLQEMPIETLYLALKKADASGLAWFLSVASPEQIQGILDLDCWKGDSFRGATFETYFQQLVHVHPVKLHQLMKRLDPEVVVRGLLEMCEVTDFDPQDPPNVDESRLLISPDNRYALILGDIDINSREALMQWMRKLATTDLDLLRRHLESCKWENRNDLEEFGYRIKKGRLEDMGFVEREEALALYQRGNAAGYKTKLAASPLAPDSKRSARPTSPDGTPEIVGGLNEAFLPKTLAEPLFRDGFLAQALSEITDATLKATIVEELLRTVNASLAADDVLQAELEDIAIAASRARAYFDLGLAYFTDGKLDAAAKALEDYPLGEMFRLGWLAVQDLARVADELKLRHGAALYGATDEAFLNSLSGRHPAPDAFVARELGLPSETYVRRDAILTAGARLTTLHQIGQFFATDMAAALRLTDEPLNPFESGYSRLLSGLLRDAAGDGFFASAIGASEWDRLRAEFSNRTAAERFKSSVAAVVAKAPAGARPHLTFRLEPLVIELFAALAPEAKRPDPRFFRALAFKPEVQA